VYKKDWRRTGREHRRGKKKVGTTKIILNEEAVLNEEAGQALRSTSTN